MWWSWKNLFLRFSIFWGCCGSWKRWFLTVAILGWCSGLERSDFYQSLLREDVVVLKEEIFNSFYLGRMLWSCKKPFITVSTFSGCGGLGITWFLTISMFDESGSLEKTDCEQFLHWEDVVVLKEEIFNRFHTFGGCGGSWKKWFLTVSTFGGYSGLANKGFLTVSTLGGCGGLERRHF